LRGADLRKRKKKRLRCLKKLGEENGQEPQAYVDEWAAKFRGLKEKLDLYLAPYLYAVLIGARVEEHIMSLEVPVACNDIRVHDFEREPQMGI
jgi:hypothetical protein